MNRKPKGGEEVLVRNREGSLDLRYAEKARITRVRNDQQIDVTGTDSAGKSFALTNVHLLGYEDSGHAYLYAEWPDHVEKHNQ